MHFVDLELFCVRYARKVSYQLDSGTVELGNAMVENKSRILRNCSFRTRARTNFSYYDSPFWRDWILKQFDDSPRVEFLVATFGRSRCTHSLSARHVVRNVNHVSQNLIAAINQLKKRREAKITKFVRMMRQKLANQFHAIYKLMSWLFYYTFCWRWFAILLLLLIFIHSSVVLDCPTLKWKASMRDMTGLRRCTANEDMWRDAEQIQLLTPINIEIIFDRRPNASV